MIPENSTSLLNGNDAIHLRPGYQNLQTRQFNINKTLKHNKEAQLYLICEHLCQSNITQLGHLYIFVLLSQNSLITL